MSFQPFGYRFELSTQMNPAAVKAAIRRDKKRWFAPGEGARGWIIGPLVCLWLAALNPRGPMVLAWISPDDFGTRIVGKAGSDLNGVLWDTLLATALLFFFFMLLGREGLSAPVILAGALVLFGYPFTLWCMHNDRRKADPLVAFVRETIRPARSLEGSDGR